jgi:hypothetical protein
MGSTGQPLQAIPNIGLAEAELQADPGGTTIVFIVTSSRIILHMESAEMRILPW